MSATAGYSGTPLAKKLGFKPGFAAAWVDAPEHFDALLGDLPDGVRVLKRLRADLDLVVCFVTARRDLERRLPRLRAALAPAGMLWIAWQGSQLSKIIASVAERADV